MKLQTSSLLTLVTPALSYPGLFAGSDELASRGLLGDISVELGNAVSGLVGDIEGLLGSIAEAVNPENLRPEPGFVFQEPKPTDSRGPCPGLNLLANYGYLPRDGHVSFGQVLEATARGFNMGADLATVLCVFAILTDGDTLAETFYLGSGPGHVGGLNRHSTVEADISPNREDYHNGCGDNHHLSSRMFKQNVKFAAQSPTKDFGFDVMAQQFAANAAFSKKNNPYIYYFPFPSIVSVAAFNFYSAFFSNGTYGSGGAANYESISSIIGAKLNKKTGEFEYVPERWPENWYRRSYPYGAVQALSDGFLKIYPANPVFMPIGQLGTKNLNLNTLLCDLYTGLNSVFPIPVAGPYEAVSADLTWALSKLALVGFTDTLLGCPKTEISQNFLYGNASSVGGPLSPPKAVESHTGNNTYYKTYFCKAPETPNCKTTC